MLHLGGILLLTWFQNFPSSCFSNIKIIYPLLDLWHTVTSELASKLPDKHYFWHTMAATLLVCGQGGRGFYAVWILVCTCILVDLKYQHSQNMCCLNPKSASCREQSKWQDVALCYTFQWGLVSIHAKDASHYIVKPAIIPIYKKKVLLFSYSHKFFFTTGTCRKPFAAWYSGMPLKLSNLQLTKSLKSFKGQPSSQCLSS